MTTKKTIKARREFLRGIGLTGEYIVARDGAYTNLFSATRTIYVKKILLDQGIDHFMIDEIPVIKSWSLTVAMSAGKKKSPGEKALEAARALLDKH